MFENLDGVWWIDDGGDHDVFSVKTLGEGRFVLGFLEWGDDGFNVHNVDGLLCELDGETYIHLDARDVNDKGEGDDKPLSYLFVRVLSHDKHAVVLVTPDPDVFAEAVESGDLSGSVSDNHGRHVGVTADKAQIDAFIDADQVAKQFVIDEAGIAHKLSTDD